MFVKNIDSMHELVLENGLMYDVSYYIDRKVEENICFWAYEPSPCYMHQLQTICR